MKPHRRYERIDDLQATMKFIFPDRSRLSFKFHTARTIGKAHGREIAIISLDSSEILHGFARIEGGQLWLLNVSDDDLALDLLFPLDRIVGWIFDNTQFLIQFGTLHFPNKMRKAVVSSAE